MTRTPLVALVLVVAACGGRDAAPADGSAGTLDTAKVADSLARPDSAASGAAAASTSPAVQKPGTKIDSTTRPIIGRDSAFGPIGAIDSTGKIVPVGTKRP